MNKMLEDYNRLNADKSKKCDTCKFSKRNEHSSHHISCELFDFKEKLQIIAMNSTTPIVTTIDGKEYPMVELNRHAMNNGWCTFPLNFDQIWVYCKLHTEEDKIDNKETKQPQN